MDDESSFVGPPEFSVTGLQPVTIDDDDTDAQAAAEARENQLNEQIESVPIDLGDDEEDSDSSDEHSSDDDSDSEHDNSARSSDEETVHGEEDSSQDFAKQSSVLESQEHLIQLNEPNPYSSIYSKFSQLEQHSSVTETDVSHDSDENKSNILDGNHSEISDGNNSEISDGNHSEISDGNHSKISDGNQSEISDVNHSKISDGNHSNILNGNHSNISDVSQSNILEVSQTHISDKHETSISDVDYSHTSNVDQSDLKVSDFHHSSFSNGNPIKSSDHSHSQISKVNHSDLHINDRRTETHVGLKNVSEHDSIAKNYNQQVRHSNELLSNYPEINNAEIISNRRPLAQSEQLYEEYLKVQVLYESVKNKLIATQQDQKKITNLYQQECENFQLYKTHAESEIDRLTSSLEQFQKCQHENNVLKGKLAAVDLQLSAEKEAKEAALGEVERQKITIQSLDQTLSGLCKSDNVVRLKQQHESIVNEMKLRHQKETLKLQEEIDRLSKDLNSKIDESKNLELTVTEMQKNYEKLQVDKYEITNKLSTELMNCQKLLESGAASEAARMKLQVEHLQEVKSKLEKENLILKHEIKSLEEELETSEAVRSISVKESDAHQSKKDQSLSESDLKTKLQKSMKRMQSLRKQNHVLTEQLEDLNKKVKFLEEKAQLYESHYKEAKLKVEELQKKLEEVLPAGSISVLKHKEEKNILKNNLDKLEKKLQDVSRRLEVSSSNEMKLQEKNKHLKSTIGEMTETHHAETIQAVDKCRKKYSEHHDNIIKKLKSEYDEHLKKVCAQYDNKMDDLKKEIELVRNARDSTMADYVRLSEEHGNLLAKNGLVSKPKEREEIERELRCVYDKKLNEKVKEEFQKYKSYYDAQLENEKVEWTKESMKKVHQFVDKTKQRLDQEFEKFREKERNDFESKLKEEKEKISLDFQSKLKEEKEKISLEYEKENNALKQKFEEEKKCFTDNMRQYLQETTERKMSEMKQKQQNEIASIIQDFQSKIIALENELKFLKEKNDDAVIKAENKIQLELQEQINNLTSELRESFQKWKNEKEELQKNYQCEINSLRQKYEENVSSLENEIRISKKNAVHQKSHIQEIQMLKEEKQAWEKEKLDFIKNEHVLNEKLSTADELEKKLMQKYMKYRDNYTSMTKRHEEKFKQLQEKINQLQSMNEELKKSYTEKENELIKVKEEFDQNIRQFGEFSKIRPSIKVSSCQTEEEVVPRSALQKVYDMFIKCLSKIQADFHNFLSESRERSAEQLRRALHLYRERLYSKIFQDALKDAKSFGPNPYVVRMNRNFQSSASSSDNIMSPNSVHHPFSSEFKISNSTPIDKLASGDTHKKLDFSTNYVSNVKVSQNERTMPDSVMRIEDLSFDFIPIPDSAYTSTNLPEKVMPSGLFNHYPLPYNK